MLTISILLAFVTLISITGRFWAQKEEFRRLSEKQALELTKLVDKTLEGEAAPKTLPAPFAPPVTPVAPTAPPIVATRDRVQAVVTSHFNTAFGGEDPAFSPYINSLVTMLYDDPKIFAEPKPPPKKSLLTPNARTCHDCHHCFNAVSDTGGHLKCCRLAIAGGTRFYACSEVLKTLDDPLNCPQWVKK